VRKFIWPAGVLVLNALVDAAGIVSVVANAVPRESKVLRWAVLAGFIIFCVLVALAIAQERRRLNEIRNARPNLRISRKDLTGVSTCRAATYSGSLPDMLRVSVVNDATKPLLECPAQRVLGHIDIYARDGDWKHILGPVIGHWTETEWSVSGRPVQSITLDANADAHQIDLLLKHHQEEECYVVPGGVAEETKGGGQDHPLRLADLRPGGRAALQNREYRLGSGRYFVRLWLRGNNVNLPFWLDVENKGRNADIAILRVYRTQTENPASRVVWTMPTSNP
jgi:hypothetical protein